VDVGESMNDTTMLLMAKFIQRMLLKKGPLEILDLGAAIVKGQSQSFRQLFQRPGWRYYGADLESGRNVDIILRDAYRWQFPDNSWDVVISGNTLEHVEYPWEFMREVKRILKPGGLTCIIAPSSWHKHRYPVDCYRYFPDGMIALCKWSGLKPLRVRRNTMNERHEQSTYLYATKP